VKRTAKQSREATKLIDHVRELRMRLLVSIGVLVAVGAVIYNFYVPILNFLRSPLGIPLFYTTPAGSFAFVMKICFMGALAITIPVIVYNLIMFVRPAFEKALPKKRVYSMTLASSVLAISGAAFGFFCIVPGSLRFFAGYQVNGLSALISADSYLNFVTNVIITFIIVFQLPLLIGFIDRVKPLKPQKLFKMEKWIILGSLIIALVVPFAFDFVTTILIALPIVVLYNLSIIIVLSQHARTKRLARLVERRQNRVSNIPSSDLILENLLFEDLLGEPFPSPVYAAEVFTNRPVMDIKRRHAKPQKVEPAAWVHRVADPIAVDPKARVISDIGRVKRSSLA